MCKTKPIPTADTSAHIAWAAGLFEGEGTALCWLDETRGRWQRRLIVPSTDKDVLDRFCGIVGAGVVVGPVQGKSREAHWKPIYRWRCTKWSDMERVARLLLPWMCERRAGQIQTLLDNPALANGRPPKAKCKRGHDLTGENVYRHGRARHCKACRRVRYRERKEAKGC